MITLTSAGNTIEEAIYNAHEAIECHIEGLLLDNESLPLKKSVEEHLEDPAFKDGVLAVVEIDISKISVKQLELT